jgi:hypothetical protein
MRGIGPVGEHVGKTHSGEEGPDGHPGPSVNVDPMCAEDMERIMMLSVDDLEDFHFRSRRIHD